MDAKCVYDSFLRGRLSDPSYSLSFIIDNATNGNLALVLSFPSFPWKIRGCGVHVASGTPCVFLVSCLMCMVIRLSCRPGFFYNLPLTMLF